MLHLVPYDRAFLDRSYDWLRDPETKALTMTPDFSRADQQAFFDGLEARTDYRVWGVTVDGYGAAGAAGIKQIADAAGEYWGYLGEKSLWGRGHGSHLLAAVERQARMLGLTRLYLDVAAGNERAIRLYRKAAYVQLAETNGVLCMEKSL